MLAVFIFVLSEVQFATRRSLPAVTVPRLMPDCQYSFHKIYYVLYKFSRYYSTLSVSFFQDFRGEKAENRTDDTCKLLINKIEHKNNRQVPEKD